MKRISYGKFSFFSLISSVAFSLISPSLQASSKEVSLVRIDEIQKTWMSDFQKTFPKLPVDPLSNAEPDKAVLTHLVWNVEPDFTKKQLIATAIYQYTNKIEGNTVLTLDVNYLEIENIQIDGFPVPYEIVQGYVPGKPDALRISIPPEVGSREVSISYHTTSNSTAVFWIDKEYSHGKNLPLMYTLFQSNEGASAIPGQHSPQIRLTYEVNVNTRNPQFMALSSVSNNPKVRNQEGIYRGLKMERAVPLYLLSLQVGNFSFKPYESDMRTGIYAEDAMLDDAYQAFYRLPEIMKAAEEICGPYNWGTYTPILLSWAFPYMAMEHPCASTCGAIALEHPNVIPHELAHSWAGNDITNATWQEFFWNEGLTTYLEYQICAKVWGEDYAAMDILSTIDEMQEAMKEYRETRPDLLRLCQETVDVEMSRIPYGKGALFFFMLEKAMGPEIFQRFLKDYMQVFFQNSMSVDRFLSFLELWLLEERGIANFAAFAKKHHINEWLYDLEIPSNVPVFYSKLEEAFHTEQKKLLKDLPLDIEKIQGWDVSTQSSFLGGFAGIVSAAHLASLDKQLNLTSSKKMSIREEWSHLCANAGYFTPDTVQMIVDYIIERNSAHKANQITAILSKTEEGKKVIIEILKQEQGRLFPIVRKKIVRNLSEW